MRVKREACGLAFNPQASINRPQRDREPFEVCSVGRRADVDVDRRMTGLVESSGDTTNDKELDVVLDQRPAQGSNALVVDGRLSHGR